MYVQTLSVGKVLIDYFVRELKPETCERMVVIPFYEEGHWDYYKWLLTYEMAIDAILKQS